MTNKEIGDAQMSECERRDSYIVDKLYKRILSGENYYCKEFPRYYHVDIYNEITQKGERIKWNTEIKCCYKENTNFLLKMDKLNNIFSVSNGIGLFLVYLYEPEKKAYFFNVKEIDWGTIYHSPMKQLKRQVQPELGYDYFETYYIPKNLAIKVVDYKDIAYAYNHETKEAA